MSAPETTTTAAAAAPAETSAAVETPAAPAEAEAPPAPPAEAEAPPAAPAKAEAPAPLTDSEKTIKKQLEFYFSDSNFRRDSFLRGKAQESVEGYVTIATLLTFKRLQSMTTDPSIVAKCVSDSTTVTVSEDKLSLRRTHPLSSKDDTKYRTMFAQLIPQEAGLDQLRTVFSSAQDVKVELVRMRRDKASKQFLGSAFVEYATQKQLRTALEYEFECQGVKLNTCSLEEFLFAANEKKSNSRGGYRDKRPYDPSSSSSSSTSSEKKEEPVEYTKGLIVKLVKSAGVELDRETIRPLFESHGKVAFIDYGRGDAEGYVRMDEAAGAAAAFGALGEKKEGALFSVEMLEGETELSYWTKIKSNQKSLYKSRGGKRGKHR